MSDTLPDYRLAAVRVFTTDLERARSFYAETLGLPVEDADATAGFVLFDTGAAKLIVEHVDPLDADLVGGFAGVSLAVADIEQRYRELVERGVRFTDPPQRQGWGGLLAHFADADGNVLSLVEGT